MIRKHPSRLAEDLAVRARYAVLIAIVGSPVLWLYGVVVGTFKFPLPQFVILALAALVVIDYLLLRRRAIAGIAIVLGVTLYACGALTGIFRFPIGTYLILVLYAVFLIEYVRDRGWI